MCEELLFTVIFVYLYINYIFNKEYILLLEISLYIIK